MAESLRLWLGSCTVNTRARSMGKLRFDLRQAMQDFEARTGIRLTYDALAQRAGLAPDTLKSMACREGYNTTLKVIASLSDSLRCDPLKYLKWLPGDS